MKKIYNVIVILLMSGLYIHGQSIESDRYDFPVKQGSREWAGFESIEKRITALQIPETVIRNISTEGLLETCLAFPYLINVFFSDNYQMGFESLVKEFNGFSELLNRPDMTKVLLKKYESLSTELTGIRLLNDVEQGRLTFRHFVLELMLAQDVTLKNLRPEQEKQLFLLSMEHGKIKDRYSDIFSNLNSVPTNLLYAKKAIGDPDFKFENAEQKKAVLEFVQAPLAIDQRIADNIEYHVKSIYKQK
ncbi:MAG: hypothetical protein LBJ47_03890 [Tannerella sp.]|jgi:hypothetical protein|nr:hypothetical protein [Tannerella sp.]